jgi:hypothetical protein
MTYPHPFSIQPPFLPESLAKTPQSWDSALRSGRNENDLLLVHSFDPASSLESDLLFFVPVLPSEFAVCTPIVEIQDFLNSGRDLMQVIAFCQCCFVLSPKLSPTSVEVSLPFSPLLQEN